MTLTSFAPKWSRSRSVSVVLPLPVPPAMPMMMVFMPVRSLLLYFQPDLTPGGFIGAVLDARHLEHAAAGDAGVAVVVFIRKIDQLLDAALDDRLGAFVAGEQRHIHPRAGQVVVRAVEDRVQFRVADIH